jgi:uncharacterized membrane protein
MEKYLTPIQYQQYLHDKSYEAAMAATVPSVRFVFGLFALVVVVVLICALVLKILSVRSQRHAVCYSRKQAREILSRRIERDIKDHENAKLFRETAEKNDVAYAKKYGNTR